MIELSGVRTSWLTLARKSSRPRRRRLVDGVPASRRRRSAPFAGAAVGVSCSRLVWSIRRSSLTSPSRAVSAKATFNFRRERVSASTGALRSAPLPLRERRAVRQDRVAARPLRANRLASDSRRRRRTRCSHRSAVARENADRRRHGLEQQLEARRVELSAPLLRLRLGAARPPRAREHAAFERARDMLERLAVAFQLVQAPLRSEVGHFGPK